VADLLVAQGINKRFGGVVAAADVNVRIADGEIVSLLGTNGAGKTTFVNMVTGYIKPDSGDIRFNDHSIVGLPPQSIARRGISRSFQIPQIFPDLTALENVIIALDIYRESGFSMLRNAKTWQKRGEVRQLLTDYQLEQFIDRPSSEMPSGARKLLDVALAVASKPAVLLLDEPTSGVSASEKFEIMDLVMAALARTKVTIMFIEHDMDIVRRYARRAIVFHEGQVLADGPVSEVLEDRAVQTHVIGNTKAELRKC